MYNSHGVISYKIQNNQIHFLLSQRRDSLNFIKVLRNLHRLQKDEYEIMMANTTPDEIERVRGYDFDPVWEDLYIVKTNKVYITERHRARQNYKEIKSFVNCNPQLTGNGSKEWGIPKGRRKRAETGYDCALREWEEETMVGRNAIRIVDTRPFYYNLKYGDKAVCVECWLAEANSTVKINHQNTEIRSYISNEVGDLKWATFEEAQCLLPDPICKMLAQVNKFIQFNML